LSAGTRELEDGEVIGDLFVEFSAEAVVEVGVVGAEVEGVDAEGGRAVSECVHEGRTDAAAAVGGQNEERGKPRAKVAAVVVVVLHEVDGADGLAVDEGQERERDRVWAGGAAQELGQRQGCVDARLMPEFGVDPAGDSIEVLGMLAEVRNLARHERSGHRPKRAA
jgi:hypothetical protein